MTPACQLPRPALTPQSCLRCGWDSVKHAKPPVQLIRSDRKLQTAKLQQVRHPAAVRSDTHRQQDNERQQAAPSRRDVENTEAASPEDNPDVEAAHGLGVRFMLALVQVYKQGISPLIPNSCRYVPTCSTFAQQAFELHGVLRGCVLTALRIARCNPLGGSGYDPVPKEWPWGIL